MKMPSHCAICEGELDIERDKDIPLGRLHKCKTCGVELSHVQWSNFKPTYVRRDHEAHHNVEFKDLPEGHLIVVDTVQYANVKVFYRVVENISAEQYTTCSRQGRASHEKHYPSNITTHVWYKWNLDAMIHDGKVEKVKGNTILELFDESKHPFADWF